MDLSHYIEELLYTNDCVIIPTIGGFIVNYSSASIDFIEQQLLPPKKSVSFNPKLVNNDGLLVNFVAQKEHITYKKATQKVDEYSQQIEADLFDKKIVHFSNIGKLYFNADSKIEFIPENTNFLRDAYGLPALTCSPILRSKDYLVKDNSPTKNNTPAVAKNRKSIGIVALLNKPRVIGAAVILLLFLASPYIYTSLFNNNSTTTIAENPVDSSNEISNASIIPTPTVTETVENNEVDSNEMIETTPEDSIVEEETPIEEEVAAIDENAEEFIIVLGAFGKERNATRLAKKLEKDNYLPDITLKNGLHRVGVQITCAPEELKTHLNFLQENYNKKAWVVE